MASQENGTTGTDDGATIPVRFRGRWAPAKDACAAPPYDNPQSFELIDIYADQISFFETQGAVEDVRVEGDRAAVTVAEQVGDTIARYAIYLALQQDGTLRYKNGEADIRIFVHCRDESMEQAHGDAR